DDAASARAQAVIRETFALQNRSDRVQSVSFSDRAKAQMGLTFAPNHPARGVPADFSRACLGEAVERATGRLLQALRALEKLDHRGCCLYPHPARSLVDAVHGAGLAELGELVLQSVDETVRLGQCFATGGFPARIATDLKNERGRHVILGGLQ